jgi:hypothetical protein
MALPSGLQTVTVTFGPYLAPDGTPAAGTVTFQPHARRAHTASGTVLSDGQVTVTLDGTGGGQVTLPASDAADTNPTSVRYTVFWRLAGMPERAPSRVFLPAATPTIDLDQLTPTTDGGGPVAVPAVAAYPTTEAAREQYVPARLADSTLKATFTPHAFPEITAFAARAMAQHRPLGICAVGDSTTTSWFTTFIAWLASQLPKLTVTRRTWSDTLQGYTSATTVQTGSTGDRYVTGTGVFVSVPDSPATSVTGDMDVRIKVAFTDWTPVSLLTLGSKNGNAGARSWWLDLNSSGNLILTISADGTNFVSKTSTAPAPFADGTTGWIRFTLDVDNGAGGYDVTFYTSTDGNTWTQLGTVVTTAGTTSLFDTVSPTQLIGRGAGGTGDAGLKAYAMQVRTGINGPPVVDIDLDALPETGTTFTDYAGNICTLNGTATRVGALGVTVFDGSVGGSVITYASDSTRFPKLTPYPADLAVINYGHTGGTATTTYLTDYQTLAGLITAKWPSAFLIGSVENPQTLESRTQELIDAHATRMALIRDWLRQNQWGVIDAYQAFVDDGRALIDVLVDDGVHPTAAGYALWDTTARRLFSRMF